MTVTAKMGIFGTPKVADDQYVVGNANATANVINPGDWVVLSGSGIAAAEDAQAWMKASGLGIAQDRNPAIDNAGRVVVNSALLVATRGQFRVSAGFSGKVLNGVLAYPVTTGSGVNVSTGVTGVGAKWQTAAPVSLSGAGATGAPSLGVAQVLASFPELGLAGTGQMDILLRSRLPDYY
jgi:hypothetical protein